MTRYRYRIKIKYTYQDKDIIIVIQPSHGGSEWDTDPRLQKKEILKTERKAKSTGQPQGTLKKLVLLKGKIEIKSQVESQTEEIESKEK